jgi:predicted site-specific integrase-resolvase
MEKLTVKEVVNLKRCGKTTVYRWISDGLVNSVLVDGEKFVINDEKLGNIVAGNTGVKNKPSVSQQVKAKTSQVNTPSKLANTELEAVQKQLAELQRENVELKQRVEKLESNPLLATAQPVKRNAVVMGFGLRFVDNRWVAYKRIQNKLYNVYVGNDVSQAESKIKTWLSERPEINAKINL